MTPNSNFYIGFSADQFAADPAFQRWVLEPDNDSDHFWQTYLLAHPDQAGEIAAGRILIEERLLADTGMQRLTSQEKQDLKEVIFGQLHLDAKGEQDGFHAVRTPIRTLIYRSAAAAVILSISLYVLLHKAVWNHSLLASADLIERTGGHEMKKILLADSTVIILNANSSISYSPDLSTEGKREVRLEGNAYFIVKKDRDYHPFVVRTRSMAVTVLGTELNVNARTARMEVVLTTGKVKVSGLHAQDEPIYLLPGDKVSLDTASHTFVKSTIDPQLYSAWTEGNWNFRQNTLEEITNLLRDFYGAEVVFKNDRNKRLRINAVIPVTSLEKLLPVLAETLRIKISLSDNKIIID